MARKQSKLQQFTIADFIRSNMSEQAAAYYGGKLHSDILTMELDSPVGNATMNLLARVERACDITDIDPEARLERSTITAMREAAVDQCNVWYFG